MDILRIRISENLIIFTIVALTIVSVGIWVNASLSETRISNATDDGIKSNSLPTQEKIQDTTNTVDRSSRTDQKAFAIFTLPFEDGNNADKKESELYTISDYVQAMEVIKSHLETAHASDGPYQNGSSRNYVIQSIRVIAKSDDIGSQPSRIEGQDQTPFDILANAHKMITVQSIDNITSAVQYSHQHDSVTHILYDIEHWSRTPQNEQQSPIESISYAGRRIQENSLEYGITPDAHFLLENYREINWTEVDFLGMQLQRFSQNLTQFSSYVKEISTHVKAANPSTVVFVQLSFRFTDAEEMIDAIEISRPWVDGYIIAYLPSSSECIPDCSPGALDRVLQSIEASYQ